MAIQDSREKSGEQSEHTTRVVLSPATPVGDHLVLLKLGLAEPIAQALGSLCRALSQPLEVAAQSGKVVAINLTISPAASAGAGQDGPGHRAEEDMSWMAQEDRSADQGPRRALSGTERAAHRKAAKEALLGRGQAKKE
jgi:hypothetical protein